jgi:hypothetical protein
MSGGDVLPVHQFTKLGRPTALALVLEIAFMVITVMAALSHTEPPSSLPEEASCLGCQTLPLASNLGASDRPGEQETNLLSDDRSAGDLLAYVRQRAVFCGAQAYRNSPACVLLEAPNTRIKRSTPLI